MSTIASMHEPSRIPSITPTATDTTKPNGMERLLSSELPTIEIDTIKVNKTLEVVFKIN